MRKRKTVWYETACGQHSGSTQQHKAQFPLRGQHWGRESGSHAFCHLLGKQNGCKNWFQTDDVSLWSVIDHQHLKYFPHVRHWHCKKIFIILNSSKTGVFICRYHHLRHRKVNRLAWKKQGQAVSRNQGFHGMVSCRTVGSFVLLQRPCLPESL